MEGQGGSQETKVKKKIPLRQPWVTFKTDYPSVRTAYLVTVIIYANPTYVDRSLS